MGRSCTIDLYREAKKRAIELFAKLNTYMPENVNTAAPAAHGASSKLKQKDNIYAAEYLGSGTFKIVKPKRQDRKRRQSALKGTTRGARK